MKPNPIIERPDSGESGSSVASEDEAQVISQPIDRGAVDLESRERPQRRNRALSLRVTWMHDLPKDGLAGNGGMFHVKHFGQSTGVLEMFHVKHSA